MLEGLPRDLQQQALLWIGSGCLPLTNAEEIVIEPGDVVQERAPLTRRSTGHSRFGVVVLVGVPPISGDLGDELVTAKQGVPQAFRRVDSPGKPACHSNDSNGGRW